MQRWPPSISRASSIGRSPSSTARSRQPRRAATRLASARRGRAPSGCWLWMAMDSSRFSPRERQHRRSQAGGADPGHHRGVTPVRTPSNDRRNWWRIAGMIVARSGSSAAPRHSDVHSAQAAPSEMEGQAGAAHRCPQGGLPAPLHRGAQLRLARATTGDCSSAGNTTAVSIRGSSRLPFCWYACVGSALPRSLRQAVSGCCLSRRETRGQGGGGWWPNAPTWSTLRRGFNRRWAHLGSRIPSILAQEVCPPAITILRRGVRIVEVTALNGL